MNVAGIRGSAGAGPDADPPPLAGPVRDTAFVPLVVLGTVELADVEDVVIDVVGVVATADEACFELPQAPTSSAAAASHRSCPQTLTFAG